MKRIVRRGLTAFILVIAGHAAHAQVLEDIELRAQDADAILLLRLTTPIQFQRASGAPRGEVAQVFYELLPARNLPRLVLAERRLAGAGGLPQIIVTDDGVAQTGTGRRLTIRFNRPVQFRVRAGRDNRTVQVVLEGLGAVLRAASTIPPLPAADTKRRYVVTLQSSSDPSVSLEASIPAAMQDHEVFYSRRVVDGRTFFDINIGYFATLPEAERARALLLRRFPQASVMPLPSAPAAAAGPQALGRPPVTAAPAPAVPAAPLLPVPLPAPAPALVPVPAPAPAPAPSTAAVPADAVAALPPAATPEQVSAQAAALLSHAQAAFDRADYAASAEALNSLLNLPPNPSSRRAQELIAYARIRQGDPVRARSELELFLKLYPQGPDSDRARQALAALPAQAPQAAARARTAVQPTTTLNASLAQYYFGGQSKTRTQEFQDSAIAGLPPSISENTVSGTDQSQLQSNADIQWRHRDAEQDLRFVFRDTYSYDLLNHAKSKNRLSALYVDHRSYTLGTSVRAGRQSPSGGGVLYRYDGVQGGYSFAPSWRVNGVVGVPAEKLLDAKRNFVGLSIDADALTKEFSASVYGTQQNIDGEIDRRAVGTELRLFSGGLSATAQLDYDVLFKDLNIAAFQAALQFADNTVINTLYDRRAVSVLTLGNLLFFQIPGLPIGLAQPTRVSELLAYFTLDEMRQQVKAVTALQQQALLGFTTPIAKQWQLGADVRLTNIGEVLPVPSINFPGSPSTGKQWSTSTQLIGSNLYSTRDSHVFAVTYLTGPTMHARLVSYNNLSSVGTAWQVEPSLRFFSQNDANGTRSQRWMPGLRLTLRPLPKVSLESDLAYESSKTEFDSGTTPPTRITQRSSRVFYFLGMRYDF